MTEEQKRIIELTYAVGLALGALELINLSPYDFNKDGVLHVIKQLRAINQPTIMIQTSSGINL